MKKIYLLFLLAFLPLLANADAVEINGIYYNLYSSNGTRTASVTSNPNSNYSGFIAIPESVTYGKVTYSVTSIRDWAFQNCSSLTSVTIPNSVTSIGYGAFSECSGLIFVDIPNSVTSIRDRAFQNCSSLTSVNIPNSVTSIGRGVFEGTAWYDNQPDGLVYAGLIAYKYKGEMPENTTLFIKEGTVGIADDAFSSCRGLTSVTIPNSVTFIGHSAFAVCGGLTSVSIPNGVTSIGTQAFMGCRSLTSITIPQSVTSIGLRSFEYCRSLESIVVESGNTVYDSRDNCDAIIETAKNSLITGCKMTVIPNSVTSIGSGAFLGCSGLTSVAIPNSVTSINSDAFADCSGLTSVTIPSSVAYIGVCAFGALASSYSMTSVTSLATTPPEMKDYSFPNYDIPLYVPKGTRDAYLAQESWNKFKEIIELENTDEDEITIKSYGKGTYCSDYDLDFSDTENLKAFIVTGYDHKTNTIWLTRVKSVPAGTGIIVKGTPGDYKVKHVESLSVYANFLVGTTEDKKIKAVEGEMTNFVLSKGEWYRFDGEITLPKGMAYLPLPLSKFAGTRSLTEVYEDNDEGTTEIRTIEQGTVSSEHDVWFTLQGQRVTNPGKGLYIRNGHKVVIK